MTAYIVLVLFLLVAVLLAFMRLDARQVASLARYGLPAIVGLVGLVLTFAGRAGLGTAVIALAAALYRQLAHSMPVQKETGGKSHVRSAALEMELDLDSGEMNGLVLVGRFEGRVLDDLDEASLKTLHEELAGDQESRDLMEAYLDRRLPAWRERFDADVDGGLGGAPGAGAMTHEEAHEILGLGPGATEAEIREAHRRLMKRVHPDTGGSPFLAARINEAKDVLLRRHR